MTRAVKLCLAVIVALAALTASAAAESIEFSPGGEISSETSELVFISEGGLINPEVTCSVTFEGELFEGPIEGNEGETIGDVQSVVASGCEGGLLRGISLPWLRDLLGIEVRERGGAVLLVRSIAEMRPGDVVIKLLRKKRGTIWDLIISGITCQFAGDITTETSVNELQQLGEDVITSSLSLSKVGGSAFCPPRAGFRGTFEALEPTQTVTVE